MSFKPLKTILKIWTTHYTHVTCTGNNLTKKMSCSSLLKDILVPSSSSSFFVVAIAHFLFVSVSFFRILPLHLVHRRPGRVHNLLLRSFSFSVHFGLRDFVAYFFVDLDKQPRVLPALPFLHGCLQHFHQFLRQGSVEEQRTTTANNKKNNTTQMETSKSQKTPKTPQANTTPSLFTHLKVLETSLFSLFTKRNTGAKMTLAYVREIAVECCTMAAIHCNEAVALNSKRSWSWSNRFFLAKKDMRWNNLLGEHGCGSNRERASKNNVFLYVRTRFHTPQPKHVFLIGVKIVIKN